MEKFSCLPLHSEEKLFEIAHEREYKTLQKTLLVQTPTRVILQNYPRMCLVPIKEKKPY